MKEGQNRLIKDRFLAARIIKQGGGGSSLWLLTHFISQGSTAQAPKPWFFTDHLPNTASLPPHPQFREVRGHLLETTLVQITLSDDPSSLRNGQAGTLGSGCEVQNALKDDTISPA